MSDISRKYSSFKGLNAFVRGKKSTIRSDEHIQYGTYEFRQKVIQTLQKTGMEEEERAKEEKPEGMVMPQEVGISLNLSKKNLKEFPEDFLPKLEIVQYLYLEGNKLTELPHAFFESLPSLKWLDLRNNCLTCLPTAGLRNHQCLEVILLQGNKIMTLPLEFATINTLKGIQTTGNPIINVPSDAMAQGFPGIIKHLKKLCSQSQILLPISKPVICKPSTSQNTVLGKCSERLPTISHSELRMWDLDKLSRWRSFIGKRSQKFDNSENSNQEHKSVTESPSKQQTKISISLRSNSKVLSRPVPFRCGTYHRRKPYLTSVHNSKMKKTRLGYKRNHPITMAAIQEKARKEALKAQVRETLEKQARKIQRMRDKDVLKSWRDHARLTKQQMKLLDNYQQYPSKNFMNSTPFDTDPEFLNMLSRVDLYRSLKDYDNRSKRIKKPKTKLTAVDLEKQMSEIMSKLQQLDTNEDEEVSSPRTRQSHVCNKMSKILDIQKTLKNLQNLNSSITEVIPLGKFQGKK